MKRVLAVVVASGVVVLAGAAFAQGTREDDRKELKRLTAEIDRLHAELNQRLDALVGSPPDATRDAVAALGIVETLTEVGGLPEAAHRRLVQTLAEMASAGPFRSHAAAAGILRDHYLANETRHPRYARLLGRAAQTPADRRGFVLAYGLAQCLPAPDVEQERGILQTIVRLGEGAVFALPAVTRLAEAEADPARRTLRRRARDRIRSIADDQSFAALSVEIQRVNEDLAFVMLGVGRDHAVRKGDRVLIVRGTRPLGWVQVDYVYPKACSASFLPGLGDVPRVTDLAILIP